MKVRSDSEPSRQDRRFTAGDGVEIAYHTWGGDDGGWVILHHGFMSSAKINWEVTRVVTALTTDGHRVAALDARGHGSSGKPLDPSAYSLQRMADDLTQLIDHLGADRFDLVGYSMGALVSAVVASNHDRVHRLVLGGIGRAAADPDSVDAIDLIAIAEALEAEDPDAITSPGPASFRAFADSVGADLAPLAAAARGHAGEAVPFEKIAVPTLVIAGTDDPIARHPAALVARIPNATLEIVPGDHLRAVGHPDFRSAITDFLARTRT